MKLLIKQFFLNGNDMPKPPQLDVIKWTVWGVCVIVLFDIVLAEDILSYNSRTAIFLIVGMVPSIWSFHDESYVRLKLKKITKLSAYLYRINLFWMVFGLIMKGISYWGEIGLPFLTEVSVFLLFWFLSIPLILVYNPWRWGGWAGIVFLVAIGYHLLLEWYIGSGDVSSFVSLCLTVGMVLISSIVSYRVSRYKIRVLFNQ